MNYHYTLSPPIYTLSAETEREKVARDLGQSSKKDNVYLCFLSAHLSIIIITVRIPRHILIITAWSLVIWVEVQYYSVCLCSRNQKSS